MEHPITTDVFEIMNAALNERRYQDEKWGTIEDNPHSVFEWIGIARRELREAEDAWCSQRGDLGALEEAMQAFAVLLAMFEQHGFVERGLAIYGKKRIARVTYDDLKCSQENARALTTTTRPENKTQERGGMK